MEQAYNNNSTLFEVRIEGPLAVIKITGNVYALSTQLDETENFIRLLTEINQDASLKTVLLLNSDGVYGEKAYDSFMQNIIEPASATLGAPRIANNKLLFLHNNVINRLIKRIVDFKKIFVAGLRGEVASHFVGSSLAADFAFASSDMSMRMTHQKYGLHPGGALPYFLSNLLHHSKATELLVRQAPIEAREALQLGLVNEVFDKDKFEAQCIRRCISLCEGPSCTLHITKRLLNFSRKGLNDYLDFEAQLLNL